MPHIHVIHENADWTAPLLRELDALGAPYQDWHLDKGTLDLGAPPPAGVFYSRMSASSHTRGHRYAPEFTACVLDWLENHGARVINPRTALRLELSKVAQYSALRRHGIRTPRTLAAAGEDALVAAAGRMTGPFITKHNRAGKGLGVRLFDGADQLRALIERGDYELSVDGVTLVQEYVRAPTPHITRVEFIGRRLLYAVRVDTSEGFELCPADDCGPGDAFCPVGTGASGAKFEIIGGFHHPLVREYEKFMDAEQMDVAAFEYILDENGRAYTYDINTNTNYNAGAEARAGKSGMRALAEYLLKELTRYRQAPRSHAA
jgi:hypothetical protein